MRIGNTHSDVYDRESDYHRDLEDALPKEIDHPVEDFFGTEIWPGDVYCKFGEHIVSKCNLNRYLAEVQKVEYFRAAD